MGVKTRGTGVCIGWRNKDWVPNGRSSTGIDGVMVFWARTRLFCCLLDVDEVAACFLVYFLHT